VPKIRSIEIKKYQIRNKNNYFRYEHLSTFAFEMEEKIMKTITKESYQKNLGFFQIQSDIKMSEELNKIVPKKLQRGKVILESSLGLAISR